MASGLTKPVDIAHAGDPRLFIVEQAGTIEIMNENGQINPEPFLDITDRVNDSGNERGLLGLAFHPDFADNGYFFVNYTGTGGHTRISRFSLLPGNPDKGDPDSELILLTVNQPFSNHNGGNLEFGPDGYLYIGMGDGGSGGDPQNNSYVPPRKNAPHRREQPGCRAQLRHPPFNPFASATDGVRTYPWAWVCATPGASVSTA